MTRPNSVLVALLFAALLAACADDGQPPAPSEAAPLEAEAVQAEPPAVVADQFQRLREWPLLDQWLAGKSIAIEAAQPPEMTPQHVADGRALFNMYCWQCHGGEGRGDGPRSPMFDPPPRDLTQGVFKFRSTASGSLPTSSDLFHTISGGLRGTGMMPFADVPAAQRWALVAYVRTLSPRFAAARSVKPLTVPPAPSDLDSHVRVTAGQQAFADLGCVQCHGESARGDGPAAATLKDVWGNALPPPDLFTRRPKRARAPGDLYASLATGLDGTPMPAYGEAASAEQLWSLVAFVRALAPEGNEQRAIEEADKVLSWQHKQGRHAVVGGCGCAARRAAAERNAAAARDGS